MKFLFVLAQLGAAAVIYANKHEANCSLLIVRQLLFCLYSYNYLFLTWKF